MSCLLRLVVLRTIKSDVGGWHFSIDLVVGKKNVSKYIHLCKYSIPILCTDDLQRQCLLILSIEMLQTQLLYNSCITSDVEHS